MNGRKAKAIRAMVYGDDKAPRFRKYMVGTQPPYCGVVVADENRRRYKKLKRSMR